MLLLIGAALAEEVASPKIINGEQADRDSFPESGAILVEGSGVVQIVCSSSLIAPDVVLTAAHCLDPAVVGFQFDAVGWSRASDLTAYASGAATDWPDDVVMGGDWVYEGGWDSAGLQLGLAENSDVGLLFLDEAVLGEALAYLPTESEAEQLGVGDEVAVVGWGMTDANDTSSSGRKVWGNSTIDALEAYEFQVGAATEAVRKCHGDSGGPTFWEVDSKARTDRRVVGVTSHAWDDTDCQESGGVDTRVDFYLDWIDSELTRRCDDGTRAWCDVPGILPPPEPKSQAELLAGIRLVGCATMGGAPGSLGLLLGGLCLVRRRRRTTRS